VRWHALFSSPFYHPTVVLDRALLDRHELRYDESYAESEDYDLWTRVLHVADGVNVREPLVLYRVHAGQATQRRRDVQRTLQRQVGLREIGLVAPELRAADAGRAWLVGAGEDVPPAELDEGVDAYLLLLDRFARAHDRSSLRPVRSSAARAVVRAALKGDGRSRARLLRRAAALDPLLPLEAARARTRRWAARRAALPSARAALAT
jgi:hypothetical protein